MGIEPGTTLAHYEIVSTLGKGGMGEVYRARDTKLDRDVAIKVLPPDFASDPERLARFEREAKALAALNHPNVATVHGFENEGDIHFLVMELAQGTDLAERLMSGPLPVDEVIPLFIQIAEGLEAAHDCGIVNWFAYEVANQGEVEIFVQAYPKGTRIQASPRGGLSPTWSRAKQELFYLEDGERMMAVSYRIQNDEFVPEAPVSLFELRPRNNGYPKRLFDVSQDGEYFYMPQGADLSKAKVVIVQNWFEELERLVPREP